MGYRYEGRKKENKIKKTISNKGGRWFEKKKKEVATFLSSSHKWIKRGVWGLRPLYLQLGSPLHHNGTAWPSGPPCTLWRASTVPHPAVEQLCLHREREFRGRTERGREGREEKKRKGRQQWWGVGCTNHVISLLLTSLRAATKGGMLLYIQYIVALPCFLYPRREKDREQRVQSLHWPSLHTKEHTHRLRVQTASLL